MTDAKTPSDLIDDVFHTAFARCKADAPPVESGVAGRESHFLMNDRSARAQHRTDAGAGTDTFSLRMASFWIAQGDTHLLPLLAPLEEIELSLMTAEQDEAAEPPDYTYTLF